MDSREDGTQETNADWDLAKLEEVLEAKEGKRPQVATKIVCRFFLDAIEKEVYGWFWQCPNGAEFVFMCMDGSDDDDDDGIL